MLVDQTRFFPWQSLLDDLPRIVFAERNPQSEDLNEDAWSLMQREGGNTATPAAETLQAALESGFGRISTQNFQRACWLRTFWQPPLVLSQGLVETAWSTHGHDIARSHFQRQGFATTHFRLRGWFFHRPNQEFGSPFCWGLQGESPRSLQLLHLVRGTGLVESALFTILPQQLDSPLPASPQEAEVVLMAGGFFQEPSLVLVVGMSFARAAGFRAVRGYRAHL